MKFGIVILSYNQPETTIDCIKSIQAVKTREFSDKQIFVVHNGSDEAVIQDLRKRFPRFYHVVLEENEGFAAGANAGLSAAFALHPWVLFLTQDTTLVHFPKSPPFEPCMSAVKIYKRNLEKINSLGGAVDLEIAKNYLCPKPELFWNSFESHMLSPYVPRTAFWIHQLPFEKLGGFDESLGTMWEDVDFSLRLRRDGEMIQLDETTEVIHHRKGICRKDPLYTQYYYNRNRFVVSRNTPRTKPAQIKFEFGLVIEWLVQLLGAVFSANRAFIFHAYPDSRKSPPTFRYLIGQATPLLPLTEDDQKTAEDATGERAEEPAHAKSEKVIQAAVSDAEAKPAKKQSGKSVKPEAKAAVKAAAANAAEAKTRTSPTATRTEADTQTRKTMGSNSGFKTTVLPPKETPFENASVDTPAKERSKKSPVNADSDATEILPEHQDTKIGNEEDDGKN